MEGVDRRKLPSVTQSRTAKIERDAIPKCTESKRTTVKNSVTRRNSQNDDQNSRLYELTHQEKKYAFVANIVTSASADR